MKRFIKTGLGLIVAALAFALVHVSPARASTYKYFGPAFDMTQCVANFGPGVCVNGAITATVTFDGVPDNYSGNLHKADVTAWTMNASGVGSLSTGANLSAGTIFSLTQGNIGGWGMQAWNGLYPPMIYTACCELDYAYNGYPTITAAGWIQPTDYGVWIGPKQFGKPLSYVPAVPNPNPPMAQGPEPNPDKNCPCDLALRGDPIDIATGNVFEQVTDYTTVGANPLAFIRFYNSMAPFDTPATALGPNWRHNYDRYLRNVTANEVDAERPDGKIITFINVSSVWTPDTDVDMTLTNSGSTYTLTDHDDVVETYTVASGTGTLNSIAFPSGYTQTLSYTTGKLTSVSDSYSRTLTLSYTGSDLTGVSTPDSATLTYGYTSTAGHDLLTSITYNTSPSTSQTYVYANSNFPFALTSITDENSNTFASWTYDTNGRCTDAQHAGGADDTQVSYTGPTTRDVTNPLGEVETYTFAVKQGVLKTTSIARAANSPVAAATRYFTYDTNGYLATATDWNGNSTHWTNNSYGEPTSITEAYGTGRARTTSITYDSTWVRKPYTITRTNQTVDYRYDSGTGNLLTKTLTDTTGGSTNGETEVWTYTYNGTGEVLTETFPRTGTTVKNTYVYTSGVLSTITDQLSHVTTWNTVNGTGQPTQITDPNSVVTNLVYNNRNWLTSKTVVASPSNEVTSYTYIGSGQPDVITLPDSSTIDFDYDNAQRVTKITNTGSETINYTLDNLGDITALAIKDSGGTTRKSWTATYDVLGDRLTLVGAGGAGQTTNYAYDGMKNRTSTTDANSKVWSQAWDELLRPKTVTDPLTNTAAPTYNNLDFITAQTDFLGYSTSYTRDAFGNAIARSSPDTGSWSFTFDEDNNLTGITDARSVVTTNTFDAVDRLSAVSITGYSGEAEAFTYDDTTAGNKGVGRLTSWSDESGSGSRIYNNFGNITSETRVINSKTYTTTYSYDLANRLAEIIYPSGRYVDYTYDSSGYLTTVTTKPSSGGAVTTLASSIVHKPFGPIASFTYGNSEALTKTYDNNYWLSTLNTVYTGTYIQELSYGYDNAGNLTGITDTLNAGRSETYTVDDLNRLYTASGAYGSRTYTYDNNSGRATRVAGATTYTTTRVSSKNRIDHVTDGVNTRNFTWTANGNMATDDRTFVGGGAVTNTFGGRDRLESASVGGNTVTFKVNAFGQRVSKAFSGTTTHFIHDITGNIIAEADGSTGSTTMEYVWMEGGLLAQIDSGGNIVYVHNDQVSNPQKITNPSRTIVWDREQEPFGETYATPTSTTPTNHRFPGQYADVEDSLSQNNARDYDPSCCYVEADPLGLAGGLNPYAYGNQNPTQNVDPTGQNPAAIAAACFAEPLACGAIAVGGAILMSPPAQRALRDAAKLIGQMCKEGEDEQQVYHRLESPTQTYEDSVMQVQSGQVWGLTPLGGLGPTVQAYRGPLPPGEPGIEFTTTIGPQPGSGVPGPGGEARWYGNITPGVPINGQGYAVLPVTITKATQVPK